MKKILFLSVFMALPFLSFAQAVEQENVEQQVNEQPAVEEEVFYMYNIVTFSGSLNKEDFSIHLDNGKKIKTLKDKDGKNMKQYSALLGEAINSIISVKDESDIDSLFSSGGTSALVNKISGLNDFELLCFLVVEGGK